MTAKSMMVQVLPLEPTKLKNSYQVKPARKLSNYSEFMIEDDPTFQKYFQERFKMSTEELNKCREKFGDEFNVHIQNLSLLIPPHGLTLDLSKKTDLLNYLLCKYDISIAVDKGNSTGKRDPLFYLALPEETAAEDNKRARIKLANFAFIEGLSSTQLVRYSRLFYLSTKDRNEDQLFAQLFDFAELNYETFNYTIKKDQVWLNRLMDLREMVDYQVVEIRNQKYFFGDLELGFSEDSTMQFLMKSDKESRDILEKLEASLAQTKAGFLTSYTKQEIPSSRLDKAVDSFLNDVDPEEDEAYTFEEVEDDSEEAKNNEKKKAGRKKVLK